DIINYLLALSASVFNFWARFMTSSLLIGAASCSIFFQSSPRSSERKGLVKFSDVMYFLGFAIYKYTKKSLFQFQCDTIKNKTELFSKDRIYYLDNRHNLLSSSSWEGISAPKVTNLPISLMVIATLQPLQLDVKPVKIKTGNSNNSELSSHAEKRPSITSSSS